MQDSTTNAMQIFTGIQSVHRTEPTVVTIGNFDGVHCGHQALLRTLEQTADAMALSNAGTALVTFEPHPLKVLRPEIPLDLLTTPRERLQIAAGLGVDIGLIQPFTPDVAALEAYDFLSLLTRHLAMAALVVGPDFALGRDRSGTLGTLDDLSKELGYQLVVQEHIVHGDRSVRSRTIRQLLNEGKVDEASSLLGRPYHMTGEVERGDQRGRQFGIPTANLRVPADKLWPADGVYATRTWLLDAEEPLAYDSVTNVGNRPTVNGHIRRLESHLLDFPVHGQSDNLYEQRLTVEFIERLRGEQRFSGPEELVEQIRADIVKARRILGDVSLAETPFFVTRLEETPETD